MATKQVDMIAQVGEMLKRMARGDFSNTTIEAAAAAERMLEPMADDRAIVIASAVLAVAAELREINNSLAALAVPDKTFLSDGAGEA